MSKYDPLKRYLEQRQSEETPMTFAEVEQVLGGPLPPSAKAHATWWSNNLGTHVGVRAWRDAGFKASRVDIGGEKVVFVRARESSAPAVRSDILSIPLEDLSLTARKLLDDYAREMGGDRIAAVTRAVHEAAIARRKSLIERFQRTGPRSSVNSVDLIREDRDAR